MSRRTPAVGAQVQLAANELAIAPMNTTGAQRILGASGRLAGASSVGTFAKLLGASAENRGRTISSREITAVSPGTGRGVLSPPTVRIETRDGHAQEIGIAASLFSPNWSRANVSARDAAAREIARRAGLD